MGVLGTLILVFIVTHMISFWARMHFDEQMPLQTTKIALQEGLPPQEFYLTTSGSYLPVGSVDIVDRTQFFDKNVKVKIAEGYKDLYSITIEFFRDSKYALAYTILYVISMIVLGFHLWHGFASAFQSLGLNNRKYNSLIKIFSRWFAVVVPALFAIIPLYIHFFLKA
jgi:succinate dehydrogenase / fumarate reductase, cytochrome b subunit